MTKEDIIRMAREAGMKLPAQFSGVLEAEIDEFSLEILVGLVRADEREACAQIAEEWQGPTKDRELHIASAIRARGANV